MRYVAQAKVAIQSIERQSIQLMQQDQCSAVIAVIIVEGKAVDHAAQWCVHRRAGILKEKGI